MVIKQVIVIFMVVSMIGKQLEKFVLQAGTCRK